MREKEKETIEDCKELVQELKQHKDKDFIGRLYYRNKPVEDILSVLLNLIENQQKELDNIKEIEKSHQEENGKLRVEFEKVYEDNLTLANELEQEKEKNMQLNEKNITYKNFIPNQSNFYDFSNYISKDKIKDFVSEKMKHLYVDSCAEDSGKYTAYKNILNLLGEK